MKLLDRSHDRRFTLITSQLLWNDSTFISKFRELALVYPDLAIRDDPGKIQGVRYDELAPMLLNEMQKQQQKIAAQDQRAAPSMQKSANSKQQLTEMHDGGVIGCPRIAQDSDASCQVSEV